MRSKLGAADFEVDHALSCIQQLPVSLSNLRADWVEFCRFIHKSLQARSLGLMRMAEYILDLGTKKKITGVSIHFQCKGAGTFYSREEVNPADHKMPGDSKMFPESESECLQGFQQSHAAHKGWLGKG